MLYGLKFFYAAVLNKDILAINLPIHKEPQKLPDILSQEEVTQIIKVTTNLKYRTMFIITYGAGLRASEVVALNIEDIDSKRMVIHVRQGKRNKDRYAILSPFMLSSLRTYWKQCRLPSVKNSSNCTPLFVNKSETNLSVANYSQVKANVSIKRKFSNAYKLNFITMYDACNSIEERGILLSKAGIYYSRISAWKKQLGLNNNKKNARVTQRAEHLTRENDQLKKRLAQAQAVIDLQKKVSDLLGTYILPHENNKALR